MFPHFSLSKRTTKTRLTEDIKKKLKNFPKKEGFLE